MTRFRKDFNGVRGFLRTPLFILVIGPLALVTVTIVVALTL